MIFILHYILFCGALPPVLVYISIYLKLYSDASMSEIGTLLMVLPFLSVIIRPFFCALADRHQAHRQFLMGALAVMAAGYGSLAVAPFFPEFIAANGRLAWYLDALGVLLGSGAFSVVWSLGDALAFNGARMAGVSWGRWKLWALVSYGLSGSIGGQLNQLDLVPRYVGPLLLLIVLLASEIVLLAVWPPRYFVMYGNLEANREGKPEVLAESARKSESEVAATTSGAAEFQLSLLKIIARRDKIFLAHMLMFTCLGFAVNCHVLYYYMQIEQLSSAGAASGAPAFSLMSTGLILSNCISEIIVLLALPRLERSLGRALVVGSSVFGYFLLLLYSATYLPQVPLHYAIAFEVFQGVISAVVYTLINDVAIETVDRVEGYLPELVARKLVPGDVKLLELKSTLRATMQGLLSGAQDGLGSGLGALVGGLFLDHLSFVALWRLCASISLSVALVYSLVQWRARSSGASSQTRASP